MSLALANSFKGQGKPCSLPIFVTFHFSDLSLKKVTLSSNDKPGIALSHPHPKAEKIYQWYSAYCEKKPIPFPLPLDLLSLSPFSQKALSALQKIGFGQTISYKQLAIAAGSPKGARAIGGVCNANPYPLIIPCHRVIQSSGDIGGFAYGRKMKEELLAHECYS